MRIKRDENPQRVCCFITYIYNKLNPDTMDIRLMGRIENIFHFCIEVYFI